MEEELNRALKLPFDALLEHVDRQSAKKKLTYPTLTLMMKTEFGNFHFALPRPMGLQLSTQLNTGMTTSNAATCRVVLV